MVRNARPETMVVDDMQRIRNHGTDRFIVASFVVAAVCLMIIAYLCFTMPSVTAARQTAAANAQPEFLPHPTTLPTTIAGLLQTASGKSGFVQHTSAQVSRIAIAGIHAQVTPAPPIRAGIPPGRALLAASNPISVSLDLHLWDLPEGSLSRIIRIEMPADSPDARALQTHLPGSSASFQTLMTILGSLDIKLNNDAIKSMLVHLHQPPRLRRIGDRLHIELHLNDHALSPTFSGLYLADNGGAPFSAETAFAPFISPVLYPIATPTPPPGVTWTLNLRIVDNLPITAIPLPDHQSEERLRWTITSGRSIDNIMLQIEPDVRTRTRILLNAPFLRMLPAIADLFTTIIIAIGALIIVFRHTIKTAHEASPQSQRRIMHGFVLVIKHTIKPSPDALSQQRCRLILGFVLLIVLLAFPTLSARWISFPFGVLPSLLILAIMTFKLRLEPGVWWPLRLPILLLTAISLITIIIYFWLSSSLEEVPIFIGMPVTPKLLITFGTMVLFTWSISYLVLLIIATYSLWLIPAGLRNRLHLLFQRVTGRPSLCILICGLSLCILIFGTFLTLQFFGHASRSTGTWAWIEADQGYLLRLIIELMQSAKLYPADLFEVAGSLLPFVALLGLFGLVYVTAYPDEQQTGRETGVYFDEQQWWIVALLTLLFAGFVVGTSDIFASLRVPLSFLLTFPLMYVLVRPTTVNTRIKNENEHLASGVNLLSAHRRELLQRAQAIDHLERQQCELTIQHDAGKIDDLTYYETYDRQQEEIRRLTEGDPVPSSPHGNSEGGDQWQTHDHWLDRLGSALFPAPTSAATSASSWRLPAPLRLPANIKPDDLALALGPQPTWWKNGVAAIRLGLWLALVPLTYQLYVLITQDVVRLLSLHTYFGGFTLVDGILRELAFWLVAAAVFGMLYPYLPGKNGVYKGAALTSVYVISRIVSEAVLFALGIGHWSGTLFRILQLLLFLTGLGVLLDRQTLQTYRMPTEQLADRYQLRNTRVLLSYLSPLALTLIGIGQQILSGQAQAAVMEVLRNLPHILPPGV